MTSGRLINITHNIEIIKEIEGIKNVKVKMTVDNENNLSATVTIKDYEKTLNVEKTKILM